MIDNFDSYLKINEKELARLMFTEPKEDLLRSKIRSWYVSKLSKSQKKNYEDFRRIVWKCMINYSGMVQNFMFKIEDMNDIEKVKKIKSHTEGDVQLRKFFMQLHYLKIEHHHSNLVTLVHEFVVENKRWVYSKEYIEYSQKYFNIEKKIMQQHVEAITKIAEERGIF